MLKKTALSLFGLVVMLVCFNPPQAHAGVVVSFGPVFPRPVYVRPYGYGRLCHTSPTGRILTFMLPLRRTFVRAGAIVQASTRTGISLRGSSIASSSNAVGIGGGKSFD